MKANPCMPKQKRTKGQKDKETSIIQLIIKLLFSLSFCPFVSLSK